jgi:hypothetical protein
MERKHRARRAKQPQQSGAAMLIAIFALLLISVVAIALVVTSGTDSSLAGNYRTATSAYYAGVAGLEEARGRLLWKNPDYINVSNSYSNLLSAAGVPTWGLTQVLYITNPASGETVDPTSSNPANYPDTEFALEFPWGLPGAAVQQIPSVSPDPLASLPGPSFKWVRINPITEAALKIDVNEDGVLDSASVLFWDPAHADPISGKPAPSLVVPPGPTSPPVPPTPTAVQALEITALAVAPNGGHRLLQYVVAPLIISPDATDQNFPAALTLNGNGVTFQSPGVSSYQINGVDGCNPPPPPGLPAAVSSIGYSNAADYGSIFSQVNPDPQSYPGSPVWSSPPPPGYTATTPSLSNVNIGYPNSTLRQSWLTPASLDSVMQDIESSADVVIPGSATGFDIASLAPLMSASNPMTIVVNGNLRLNGRGFVGYGLLLVTGTLTYDPDASWNGIVLVVGQGIFASNGNGSGGIVGAVLTAQTRDSSGNLLPGNTLGTACFGSDSACGVLGFGHGHHGFGSGYGSTPGSGVSYNSCAVNSAKGPLTYKVLSFHEIPLPN